jgi:hypothetical protein
VVGFIISALPCAPNTLVAYQEFYNHPPYQVLLLSTVVGYGQDVTFCSGRGFLIIPCPGSDIHFEGSATNSDQRAEHSTRELKLDREVTFEEARGGRTCSPRARTTQFQAGYISASCTTCSAIRRYLSFESVGLHQMSL